MGSIPKWGEAAGLSLSILCWSSQAGHRHPRPPTWQQIRETTGVPTLLLPEALAAHKHSCWAVLWASVTYTLQPPKANHTAPSVGPTSYFNRFLCQACPLARGHPLVLGSLGVWSHFWADSIRSCGKLLRGEEVGGTDGDAAAEPNPRVETMGAGPAWHRVREEWGGGIWHSWSFYPSW